MLSNPLREPRLAIGTLAVECARHTVLVAVVVDMGKLRRLHSHVGMWLSRRDAPFTHDPHPEIQDIDAVMLVYVSELMIRAGDDQG